MVTHIARVWINRVRLPVLHVVGLTGKMNIPCPRSCLRIWSRETGSAVPSRVSPLISILRLNLVLTYEILLEFRGGVHLFIYNHHTPSGQSRVYRVTQLRIDGVHCLPRVRRNGASKPQGSSERVLPWQVTMCVRVCVFSSYSFWTSSSLDVPAGVTQEEGHTGFLIHLSTVRALIFLARRIQPFLSLVDREVESCVLTIYSFSTRWAFLFLFFSFLVRKIPFAGIELTSQRVRGLRGTSELPGRPADQLIFASLSHTHYWYEMGMLKVSAVLYTCENVCMVTHIARVRINRVRLPILLVCS